MGNFTLPEFEKNEVYIFSSRRNTAALKQYRVLNAELTVSSVTGWEHKARSRGHRHHLPLTPYFFLCSFVRCTGRMNKCAYNLQLVTETSVAECMRMYGLSYWSHSWHARHVCCTGRVTLDATWIRWRND